MPERPQPGNRTDVNPDVGKRGTPEKTSTMNVLKLILVGMSPVLLSGDTPKKEFQPKSSIEVRVQPQPEVAPKLEENVGRVREGLAARIKELRSLEYRKRSRMLNPKAGLQEACRDVGDWMLENNDDLKRVWSYIYERNSAWPSYLKNDFDTMIKDMEKLPNSPRTLSQLDAKTTKRLVEKEPLTCGMAVWLASFIIKTEDVQERGIGVIEHIAQFLNEELKSADTLTQSNAYVATQALARVLENVMTERK